MGAVALAAAVLPLPGVSGSAPQPDADAAASRMALSQTALSVSSAVGAGSAVVPVRTDAERESLRPRASRADHHAAATYVRPTEGPVTSGFGHRWGRLHAGLDFGADTGTPVRAVTAGTVLAAAAHGGYGLQVTMRHAGGTITTYSHLSRLLVRPGPVRAGHVVGLVGSTGRSTGPHLHFEVRPGGPLAPAVNPAPWLRARSVRL